MKKTVHSIIMLTALVLSVIHFTTIKASASDSVQNATPIDLNKEYLFSGSQEDNFYKITVPQNGRLQIKISNESDYYREFSLINSKGVKLFTGSTDYSEYADGYASHTIGVTPGVYYINVYNDEPDSVSYKLGAFFTPSENWEKEPDNDEKKGATAIPVNTSFNGAVDSYEDSDFYTFTTTSDGVVNIKLSNNSSIPLKYELFNDKGVSLQETWTDYSDYAMGYSNITQGLPKGKYYIQIVNDDDAYNNKNNHVYSFRIDFNSSHFWEKESNDTAQEATNLELDQYYQGVTPNEYDEDFYTFNLSKGTTIQLNALNLKEDYTRYTIIDSHGNEKAYLETNSGAYANGYKTSRLYLPTGSYFLNMHSYDSDNHLNLVYKFAIKTVSPSVKSSGVTITNNKGKSDKVYVKNLLKDDIIKIYSSKSKLLASKKSEGSSTTAYLKQLGKSAGSVYVTLTRDGRLESSKVKVNYKAEKK